MKVKTVKDESELFYTVRELMTKGEDGREFPRTKKIVVYTLDKKKVAEAVPYEYPFFPDGRTLCRRIYFHGINYAEKNAGIQRYILKIIKKFHKNSLTVANTYRAVMNYIKDACTHSTWEEVQYLGNNITKIIMEHDEKRLKESFEKRKKWISSKINDKNQYSKYSKTERIIKEKELK